MSQQVADKLLWCWRGQPVLVLGCCPRQEGRSGGGQKEGLWLSGAVWPVGIPTGSSTGIPEESTWEGLGGIRAETECPAPGTRKQLKQFLLWCPGMYNGKRPVGLVYYSVFGNLNSNQKMHFSHVPLNRDELLQEFVDGNLSALDFIRKLSPRTKMCSEAGKCLTMEWAVETLSISSCHPGIRSCPVTAAVGSSRGKLGLCGGAFLCTWMPLVRAVHAVLPAPFCREGRGAVVE